MSPTHMPFTRICAALFIALLTLTARAEVPVAEKILPADTLFVLSIPDYAKMRAIVAKSPQSKLWNDSALRPFHDKFMSKWTDEFVEPLERDLGVKLDDYSSLPQGQLTFAVTQNGWTGDNDVDPGIILLLDAKDKSDQLKKNLTDLRKKWTDSGKAVKTEKIRDLEFTVVPLSSNDVPKTLRQLFPQKSEEQELGKEPEKKEEKPDTLVVGQFESLLIVGNTTKTVERIVSRLTGGSAPALADDPAFEQNRLAQFRDSSLFAWFNAKNFFDALSRLPTEKPNPQAPSILPSFDLKKILSGLGLTSLKTITLNYKDTPEGTAFEFFIGAPAASRQGLFKLLTPEAKDAGPPAWVPADAVKFQRWRIDGQKTIATLEKTVGDIFPPLIDTWNYLLKNADDAMKETDAGFSVRKSLFANLGDDIVTYQKAPRGTSLPELRSPPSLVAIGSPNADQLARALPGLLQLRMPGAAKPDTREFLGKKIYSVELVPAYQKQPAKVLSYAASGGYVAFSSDAAILEEFLRSAENPAKPLRETPGLADAAQRVGGQATGMFCYENEIESMRQAFELLKNAGAANSKSSSSNPLATALPFTGPEKTFKDWADFSLLPEFSKVSKYFYFSVWANNVSADGLTFKYFSPTPPGAK